MSSTPYQNEDSCEHRSTHLSRSREALFQLACAVTLGLMLLLMSSVTR